MGGKMKIVKRMITILLAAVLIVSVSITTFGADGYWIEDSSGWWYQNADGTYPCGSWKFLNNSWYHFNDMGYMETGWIQDGDNWYYLGGSGEMQTGWLYEGSSWYYLDAEGKMLTRPQVIDGVLYFFADNGAWEYDYISEEPNYEVYFSNEGHESAREVEMVLGNYGTKTLRIYSENAYLTGEDYESEIDIYDISGKEENLPYFDIPAGTIESVLLFAYDSSASFMEDFILRYDFYYDRMYYTGFSNNSNGTSFFEKRN